MLLFKAEMGHATHLCFLVALRLFLVYSKSMKALISIAIFLAGLFFFAPVTLASDFDLGFLAGNAFEAKLNKNLLVNIAGTTHTVPQTEVTSWLTQKNLIAYDPSYRSEIENTHFCLAQKSLLCNLTFSARKGDHLRRKTFVKIDTPKLTASLANLAQKVNRDPVDARLKIEDGKVAVFSLSEKGFALDEKKSAEKIHTYLENPSAPDSLDLPYTETEPDVLTATADNMHFDTLLGEGRSNFRGSTKNRIWNIKVATERFNGLLIKPNEEFSFVRVLGEVDGEHGYLPELVIKKDKTEPEFGGGICQVSTTTFRAAIYSGLLITARQNHAYPVSYYNPQGMDSTVYIPRPDLRFKNDTPDYILIQTKIEGTELIFRFYGISDGRTTKVLGPTVLEKNPDGSMKTSFTQEVYDRNNALIREVTFKSNYDSPSKYPHPATSSDLLSEKPKGWSDHEWSVYKKAHNLP